MEEIKIKIRVGPFDMASANMKSCKRYACMPTTAADEPLVVACRVLIASIMEEFNKGAWEELIERCEESGVDAFEINFSCPHGMPERKMGMAMGQDPEILQVYDCPALALFSQLSSQQHAMICIQWGTNANKRKFWYMHMSLCMLYMMLLCSKSMTHQQLTV